ncbi:MAG: rhomboid family intramembrane serine protease [Methylotenera sp.]|nr:rhomboid family intramembrane serine protease [Oligoflexia bacterium]
MSTLLKKTLLSTPPENGSATVSAFSIAFIALIFFAERAGLLDTSRYLAGTGRQVFEQHHYWRAFTTTLVHADLGHLFSNSIFFTGLAFLLNGYFGKWIFPVLSFLAGGVINLMILPQYPADVAIIGASGIVYFMAALWLTLYFMIDRRHSIARRLINVIALSLILTRSGSPSGTCELPRPRRRLLSRNSCRNFSFRPSEESDSFARSLAVAGVDSVF